MNQKNIMTNIVWVILCLGISGIAGYVTAGSVHSWFVTLHKPSFNPPSWVFGPVWTVLYIMIGLAGARIWRVRQQHPRLFAIFLLQLLLNFAWSFLFFGSHNIFAALVNIVLLWLSILIIILISRKIDKPAAWLLTPYLLWVTFASVLNVALWILN